MRCFLKKKVSGVFYCGDGGWTSELQRARDFARSSNALAEALRERMRDVEIVLVLGDREGPLDVVLQVGDYGTHPECAPGS